MAAGGRGGAKNAESCIARSRLVLLVVVVSGGSFYYMHPPLFYSLESPSSIRPPFQIHSTFSFIHEGGRARLCLQDRQARVAFASSLKCRASMR